MSVQCTPYGGAPSVGGSCYSFLFGQVHLLVDWGGGYHGHPQRGPAYPVNGPSPDHLFLTHAHLDHLGMAVVAIMRFPRMKVWATAETKALAASVWAEMCYIADLRRLPAPFGEQDIGLALRRINVVTPGEKIWLGENLNVQARYAGHIPGAVSYIFGYRNEAYVVTGDISFQESLFSQPAELFRLEPNRCRLLLREATYLDQPSRSHEDAKSEFLRKVVEVPERGGQVLIPVLATGRAQEVIGLLASEGITDRFPVYLDGAARRTEIIRKLSPNGELLRFNSFSDRDERQALRESHQPAIIVATSGMMALGSLSAEWARAILPREENALFLVNWAEPCSPAGQLLRQRDSDLVDLNDPENPRAKEFSVPRRASIERFSFFSSHMSNEEGLEMEESLHPDVVVYVHGEDRRISSHVAEHAAKSLGSPTRIKGEEGATIIL